MDRQPDTPDASAFEVVDAVIAEFGGDRYILGPCGGEAGMVLLGGMERGLLAYALQPHIVARAIAYETRMANLRDPLAIRPGTDGVLWGTDFAATTGPFISPRMFRTFCLPSIRSGWLQSSPMASPFSNTRVATTGSCWTCSSRPGYDAYQSIQASASMDLGQVKARYGGRLALWGGARVESLVSGTSDDVRRDVAKAMQVGAPGGGYIFGTSHSVAVGTKYDNFMAMLDAYHHWAEQAAQA